VLVKESSAKFSNVISKLLTCNLFFYFSCRNAEDEYLEEINPLSNAFIYQLINGANFFDIEPILDSLISIITFRFFNESCSFILKEFDLEICKIPYELIKFYSDT
jgi:hypothetical protein